MTLTAIALKLLAGTLLFGTAAPVKGNVTASHTPKINTHWNYVVRATQGGKPVGGRITEVIIDPIGGHHPVGLSKGTKTITNWPFKGELRGFIVWPAQAKGYPLQFHVVV